MRTKTHIEREKRETLQVERAWVQVSLTVGYYSKQNHIKEPWNILKFIDNSVSIEN